MGYFAVDPTLTEYSIDGFILDADQKPNSSCFSGATSFRLWGFGWSFFAEPLVNRVAVKPPVPPNFLAGQRTLLGEFVLGHAPPPDR